jgi:hypothetical protein
LSVTDSDLAAGRAARNGGNGFRYGDEVKEAT